MSKDALAPFEEKTDQETVTMTARIDGGQEIAYVRDMDIIVTAVLPENATAVWCLGVLREDMVYS